MRIIFRWLDVLTTAVEHAKSLCGRSSRSSSLDTTEEDIQPPRLKTRMSNFLDSVDETLQDTQETLSTNSEENKENAELLQKSSTMIEQCSTEGSQDRMEYSDTSCTVNREDSIGEEYANITLAQTQLQNSDDTNTNTVEDTQSPNSLDMMVKSEHPLDVEIGVDQSLEDAEVVDQGDNQNSDCDNTSSEILECDRSDSAEHEGENENKTQSPQNLTMENDTTCSEDKDKGNNINIIDKLRLDDDTSEECTRLSYDISADHVFEEEWAINM